ncbi:MAG: polysaccharide biosynthesis tyrosine autokinase [Endomicrobia bacterium]|nr:polysaccharide biosynthesis tyrosine autokinase [Endomicrobiia bacterium]
MESSTEISLWQLFGLMLKNKFLLCFFAMLGAVAAFALTRYVLKNQYESSAKFYVYVPVAGQQSADQDLSAVNLAQKIVSTYVQMLDTLSFYHQINEDVKLSYTDLEMQELVTFSIMNSTEIFQVTVKTTSPDDSFKVAQAVTKIAPQVIQRIQETASLKIVDQPVMDSKPVSPSLKTNLAVGALAGLLIAALIVFIRDLMDTKIKSADDLYERYGLHILSEVGDICAKERRKRRSRKKMKFAYSISDKYAEAYRTARINLNFSIIKNGCKKIAIVSSINMEGKTTTAVNLAIALSRQLDEKVLLVDCDLRKPRIYHFFDIKNVPGLTDYLSGISNMNINLQTTAYENLSVLCSGTVPPNPSELLASKAFAEFVEKMEASYDYIIFDTSPLNLVSDALSILHLMDGVVISSINGESVHPQLSKTLDLLKNAGKNVTGVVLHGVEAGKVKYSQY